MLCFVVETAVFRCGIAALDLDSVPLLFFIVETAVVCLLGSCRMLLGAGNVIGMCRMLLLFVVESRIG